MAASGLPDARGEVPRAADAGHVIVCGLNDLGLSIVEQLDAAGLRVVVVDDHDSPVLRRRLERLGVALVPESARLPEALRQAGLDSALALVACHGTDLENLRICLVATDGAPRTRIVASIDNPQLGGQLQDAFAQVRVRSLGELAAPGFVEACVRSTVVHAFALDATAAAGEIFAVVDEEVTAEGPFRVGYGDLTPISLRRAGGRQAVTCPPRDVRVAPGDRLIVMGRLGDLRDSGLAARQAHDARLFASLGATGRAFTANRSRDGGARPARRADRRTRGARQHRQVGAGRLRALFATVRAELDRPFRHALALVAAVLLVSTVALTLTYRDHNPAAPPDFNALDALYLTVQTAVTVGYGDYNFSQADSWLKAFGVCLMVFGAVSVAVVYAFITNVIVGRRLERTLGLGRAGTVRDHVILCGLGSVGVATMEGILRAGHPLVVIERDRNNRYLPVAHERGVPVVIGDATVRSTLLEAGLEHAATIAAMTSDGHTNLETVLSARESSAPASASGPGSGSGSPSSTRDSRAPLRIVMRVFDATMVDEVERRFGIHRARSATALATPHFLAAVLGHEVISAFYVEHTPFLVARMTVRADGGLAGPTLAELALGTRVLAVIPSDHPGSTADPAGTTGTAANPAGTAGDSPAGTGRSAPDYRPGRHTRLRTGDELVVVGPVPQIIDLVRRNRHSPTGHTP
ncbi:NAD-binding protein [Frankia sp. EI5c]|uniref:NAD-binding protein n=1 Tax=Frankia sp. EI5c TaxID=683316 RepID=UPI0028C4C403|nr:NAD-binding protein [Frankia sp. EI5c]